MTSPRISIIGSALSGNMGAVAMLESSIASLSERIPGVRFTLFSMYPDEDAARNTHDALDIVSAKPAQLGVTINVLALAYRVLPPLRRTLRRRSRAIGALAESQVLLDQGGITFVDGREKFLLYNVASILPAIMMKTAVFKCAQAVGPFRHRVNHTVARLFLPRVSTLVTRGRITHDYAVGLGLTNLVAGADFAFSLELAGTEHDTVGRTVDLGFFDEGDVVGFAPSVVVQKKEAAPGEYIAKAVALIEGLVAKGHRVMLMPHSIRTATTKQHNNDLPLSREIYAKLDRTDAVLFIDTELGSQELRYLIGLCSTFIASRFHAMVSALSMGVPCLVIGWGHKYEEVLEMFGLQEWATSHADATLDTMVARFEGLHAQRDAIRAKIIEALPAVKERSIAQADLIAALVSKSVR